MQTINTAVDKYTKLILEAERYVWCNPETGYKEFKTSKYLSEQFEKLGYTLTYATGITGFYTVIDTGRPGPEIMILGELDSIICPAHPQADPATGAVHSCGHNAQCAALLGVAAALTEPDVTKDLCGRIRLCAVPAEELLELEYRNKLKAEGIIKYLGGKSEFLSRGYFDGVDIAFMVHTSGSYGVLGGSVGCIAKNIVYKGTAAHAGGSPWNGRNALYAATCGINAVNALRETFKDSDLLRFHPIITHGGDMVNAIPETVSIETYVRGKSYEAMVAANKRIDQALIGAALSLDNNVEIIDIPGYAPLKNDENMMKLAQEAAQIALPERSFFYKEDFSTGSTDMGDLSCIMPVVHPYAGGAEGNAHGNNYYITDPIAACVDCAKWQLTMLKLLLENNAQRALKIKNDFTPLFTKDEFLSYQDALNQSGNRIIYNKGEATVKL